MFSVMFEVHPRPGQVDCDLADSEMLTPELEQIDGFVDNVRYRSLTRGTADRARTARPHRAPTISLSVAIGVFPAASYRAPRSWPERAYPNLTYFNKVAKGGDFAAWEEPDCSLPSSAPGSDPFARTHQAKCPRPFHHQRTFT